MCAEVLSVSNFYDGKSIFITGATGGIGKLLIEKLLRSCPKVKNLYLLLRSKKGRSANERLTNLFNTTVFHKLRECSPDVLSKVLLVEGDLCINQLNLSDYDRDTLINNISIVFHCAASLKFDSTVDEAISHNVFGTRRLLHLCHQMRKIEAFVHVSTLYSTCNRGKIEERIPSIPALSGILDFNKSDDDFLKIIPHGIVKEWPNTYTFSKALAEVMLDDQKGRFPISVVRPSIVLSTLKEPVPGWIDNFYGPTVSITNGALGILRTVICDGNKVGDIVPSDVVVNLLICVGCKTKYEKADEVKVYNCCSGRQNPVKMKQLLDDCQKYFRVYPLMAAVRYPNLTYRSSHLVHSIVDTTQHKLFAYVVDFVAICTSRRARMTRAHRSLSRVLNSLTYFTVREWPVDDHNVEKLYCELSKKEKEIFYFDVKAINWKVFTKNYALGIRKYLLKEDLDNMEDAVARINNLYWIEKSVQLVLSMATLFTIYNWIRRRRRKS